MKQKTPEFVAKRIVWALKNHQLPALSTRLFSSSDGLPHALQKLAESGKIGDAVACCVGDDEHWTVLGTTGIGGKARGKESSMIYDEISEIQDGGTEQPGRPSVRLNATEMAIRNEPRCLKIHAASGVSNVYWFATPQEFSAFWNILLRLTPVQGKQLGLR
jgi:hypothetical protein